MITVRLPTALRPDADGAADVSCDMGAGTTLGAVLESLFERHPRLRSRVLDETGAVRRFVNVYVGDDEVGRGVGLQAPVHDGQTVHILPSVAGGA